MIDLIRAIVSRCSCSISDVNHARLQLERRCANIFCIQIFTFAVLSKAGRVVVLEFSFFHGLFMAASLSSNEFLEIVDGTILGEEMGDASRLEALFSAFFVRDSRENHGRAAEFGHRCCIKHFLN